MKLIQSLLRPAAAASAVALLSLALGCSRPADRQAVSVSASTPTQPDAAKLGELFEFSRIASDVATLVDKGELPAAKVRIKDLEVAWDSAEAGLKPRAAHDWHVLDKAIDHALSALRADPAVQSDCALRMAELMASFKALQGGH